MNRVISAVVVLIGVAAPAWAGFDEGVAAYQRGDYATALREWRPLANQGNAAAQSNLGRMYEAGKGVPQYYAQAMTPIAYDSGASLEAMQAPLVPLKRRA